MVVLYRLVQRVIASTPKRSLKESTHYFVIFDDVACLPSGYMYFLNFILFSHTSIKETPFYGATVKIHEPVGVIGIACPDSCPLLAFVSLLAPAVIRGNTVVIIPSYNHPMIAVDMYQVLLPCF